VCKSCLVQSGRASEHFQITFPKAPMSPRLSFSATSSSSSFSSVSFGSISQNSTTSSWSSKPSTFSRAVYIRSTDFSPFSRITVFSLFLNRTDPFIPPPRIVLMPIFGVVLFGWAVGSAGGFGSVFNKPTNIVDGRPVAVVFFSAMSAAISPKASLFLRSR